jgi:hypothetical protein
MPHCQVEGKHASRRCEGEADLWAQRRQSGLTQCAEKSAHNWPTLGWAVRNWENTVLALNVATRAEAISRQVFEDAYATPALKDDFRIVRLDTSDNAFTSFLNRKLCF